MKYIAVFHHWWMHSIHFEVETIEADCLDDAEIKADAMAHRKSRSFNHCRSIVLEIGKGEHLIRRRLTWRERFTGRITSTAALEAKP